MWNENKVLCSCRHKRVNVNSRFSLSVRCQSTGLVSSRSPEEGGEISADSSWSTTNTWHLFVLQALLNPLGHMLGIRKQLRKRAGNSECFWKYCVWRDNGQPAPAPACGPRGPRMDISGAGSGDRGVTLGTTDRHTTATISPNLRLLTLTETEQRLC